MTVVQKPRKEDLENIAMILSQWTEKKEVDKYIGRISNEIGGKTEFSGGEKTKLMQVFRKVFRE